MEKQTILIVDDTPLNLRVLAGILSENYRVRLAGSGMEALTCMLDAVPDLVLLDVSMPGMDGIEVCRRLKSDPRTRAVPVIFVSALGEMEDERRGFEAGAVDYVHKPVRSPVLLARVKTHLALADQNRELERKVLQRTQELNATRLEIIRRLGRAAEYKDNETGLHVLRMSYYSRAIALSARLDSEFADLLLQAAPMHDIGKIGIPDGILLKPGKLDEEEWKVMRRHPQIGAGIIGRHASPLLEMARVVALTHHEKWDGSGYPRGRREDDIPVEGRIVAIADVFDALTTERPYKKAWEIDHAVCLIRRESGAHFDPALVEAFLAAMPEILQVQARYAEQSAAAPAGDGRNAYATA